jgi:predicted AAA+ superfamily ATPase
MCRWSIAVMDYYLIPKMCSNACRNRHLHWADLQWGVGKTSTALRRAATVVALDDSVHGDIAAADIGGVIRRPPPVLLDEWQRPPALWDAVRRAVDADDRGGQFLLTGLTALATPSTHSGAGRIPRVRTLPLSLSERGVEVPTVSLRALLGGARPGVGGTTSVQLADYAKEIVASGFPAIPRLTARTRAAQLDGYVARIVDRRLA